MTEVHIGERIQRLVSTEDMPGECRNAWGRVVYIHPERRFFVVEFEFPRERSFRESYPLRSAIDRTVLSSPNRHGRNHYDGARFAVDAVRTHGKYAEHL